MNKILLILLVFFFACGQQEAVPEPEKLLSEKEMENIIYDLAILQAMKYDSPKVLEDNNIDVRTYIYKKYKTDSLTYNQNHKYYASKLDVYEEIQKNVIERLNKQKTPADSIKNKKNQGKNKIKQ